MHVDPQIVAAILKEGAAKYIMPRYKTLQDDEISTKTGPGDLVTIADRETEKYLEKRLPELLPGSIVIGEEGVSEGYVSTTSLLDENGVFWVVDPVDGTYNFRHGKRHFALMAALVINGMTVMSWIYDIIGDEMMIAEAGGGTYMNGQKQTLSGFDKDASAMTGYAYYSVRKYIGDWKDKVKKVNTLRCSGHEYLNLIRGDADFGVYNRCRPWDHLPGSLGYIEAGGVVKNWDDGDYKPEADKAALIIAPSDRVWQNIRDNITDKKV